MFKVKVKGDEKNNVIIVSENNPEYGWIVVEQDVTQINDRGWLKTVTRTARINGKIEDLKLAGYTKGMQIPGKIVVHESLVPFNTENPDKDLKLAGSSKVICRLEDQPIYRQSFFTSNQNAYDELIPHTNSDEIRDVMEAQRAMEAMKADQAEAEL